MTNDEAKLLLRAYRATGADAGDPQFREALEQAKRDPALAQWFADEQAITEIIGRKIKTGTPVPPDLRQSILAARNVTKPRPWVDNFWRHAAVWIVVAAVAVALGVTWSRKNQAALVISFANAMAEQASNKASHVALETNDLKTIQTWLAAHQGDAAIPLPPGLAQSVPAGCHVIDWNGRAVSLICFWKRGGPHIDLFVVKDDKLARGTSPRPTSRVLGGRTTLVWRDGERVYLMAARMHESDLRKVL